MDCLTGWSFNAQNHLSVPTIRKNLTIVFPRRESSLGVKGWFFEDKRLPGWFPKQPPEKTSKQLVM